MKTYPILVSMLLALAAGPVQAQDRAFDPVCRQAVTTPIPASDLPPPDWKPSDSCNPMVLHPAGLRTQRWCGYAWRTAEDTPAQGGSDMMNIAGNAGLAMIYAQGRGVAPNLRLAERFACEIVDWEGGNAVDVAQLIEAKRKSGARTVAFDMCDHVTGRQMNYMCIVRDEGIVAKRLASAQRQVVAGANPAQIAAFHKVIAARKAFLDEHTIELGNGTTGIVQYALREEVDTDQAWAESLEAFTAGKLPSYSAQEFAKIDTALNVAYQRSRKEAADCTTPDLCATTERLITIERAWLRFRDAWVEFATARWPSTSSDTWMTWVTLDRAAFLANS